MCSLLPSCHLNLNSCDHRCGVKELSLMAYNPIAKMRSDYKHRAKRNGYKFDLGYSEFLALVSSPCVYCHRDPEPRSWTKNSHNLKLEYFANGVDRIDSNFGYTVANTVACCGICNSMKGSMTHEDFIEHLKKIVAHYVR